MRFYNTIIRYRRAFAVLAQHNPFYVSRSEPCEIFLTITLFIRTAPFFSPDLFSSVTGASRTPGLGTDAQPLGYKPRPRAAAAPSGSPLPDTWSSSGVPGSSCGPHQHLWRRSRGPCGWGGGTRCAPRTPGGRPCPRRRPPAGIFSARGAGSPFSPAPGSLSAGRAALQAQARAGFISNPRPARGKAKREKARTAPCSSILERGEPRPSYGAARPALPRPPQLRFPQTPGGDSPAPPPPRPAGYCSFSGSGIARFTSRRLSWAGRVLPAGGGQAGSPSRTGALRRWRW